MNKIMQFIKIHSTITVSVVAIAALVLSNWQFIANAAEDSVPASETEQASEKDAEPAAAVVQNSLNFNIPNASCINELLYDGSEGSTVYNPNQPYSLSFFHTESPESSFNGFQDINGDSLPDYIFSRATTGTGNYAGTPSYLTTVQNCLYLNNGSGWDKTYQCYAFSAINSSTAAVLKVAAFGDCAG